MIVVFLFFLILRHLSAHTLVQIVIFFSFSPCSGWLFSSVIISMQKKSRKTGMRTRGAKEKPCQSVCVCSTLSWLGGDICDMIYGLFSLNICMLLCTNFSRSHK